MKTAFVAITFGEYIEGEDPYQKGCVQAKEMKKADEYQPMRLTPGKSSVIFGIAVAMIVCRERLEVAVRHIPSTLEPGNKPANQDEHS